MDHPVVNTFYKDITNSTPKYMTPSGLWEALQLLGATIKYMLFRAGPMATNVSESIDFVKRHLQLSVGGSSCIHPLGRLDSLFSI